MSNACKKENAVAFCHYHKHKGTLSADMVKHHECNKKQCPYLEKYETNSYWIRRSVTAAFKKYHKDGCTGVIAIGDRYFYNPNFDKVYQVAKDLGKKGVVPEIRYIKDFLKYYLDGEL